MDTPGYPQEYRAFYLGHAAALPELGAALVLSPAGDFDHVGTEPGGYRFSPADAGSRVSYPTFAVALLDEIEAPTHHSGHIGVVAVA